MKLDPYLNVDPGTMSPYQHGEVFVTDDGAETDLDLGHYERFIDENLSRASNVTTGQVYSAVIAEGAPRRLSRRHDPGHPAHHERDQAPDHARLRSSTTPKSSSARSAARSATSRDRPSSRRSARCAARPAARTCCTSTSRWFPTSGSNGELKTKPTQQSVRELRAAGIQPDVIVCRADAEIPDDVRDKIALFCDVDTEAVIPHADRRDDLRSAADPRGVRPRRLHRPSISASPSKTPDLHRVAQAGRADQVAAARRSGSRSSASTSICTTPT